MPTLYFILLFMNITAQLRLHYLTAKSVFQTTETDQRLSKSPQTHQFYECTTTEGKRNSPAEWINVRKPSS